MAGNRTLFPAFEADKPMKPKARKPFQKSQLPFMLVDWV